LTKTLGRGRSCPILEQPKIQNTLPHLNPPSLLPPLLPLSFGKGEEKGGGWE